MKKILPLLSLLLLSTVLFAGCVHFNITKQEKDPARSIEENALQADPVDFNADGKYDITFHYDKGGFKDMDMGSAYVAYYPEDVFDTIENITGEEQDIPDEIREEAELEKIAVITCRTTDDQTVTVSFTDKDQPPKGRTYYFIIPDADLAGAVTPDRKTGEAEDDADDEDSDDNEEFPGAKFGYNGDDPVEMAVYEYLVDEIGDYYDSADACIPVVHIFHMDYTNEKDIKVYGDYWIYNYKIERDTLKCVSGGDHPGCMHVVKEDDEYEVRSFDAVEDGAGNTESAKKIFGDHYEDFAAYQSDQDTKDEDRYYAVMDYVNMNEIPCTKFQDEGWDPIELHL